MATQRVFQTDPNGVYVGETVAHESPLEPGVFAMPAGCVGEEPPLLTSDELARWVDGAWTVETIPPPPPPPPPPSLADWQAGRIAEAWALWQSKFAASTVTVPVGGAARQYGCDPVTRENISAINTAISRAPSLVPNPRPFTPRNAAPVATSHDEFLAIYLAGIAQGDAYYQAYAIHKLALQSMTTIEAVAAYDLTAGWPE